MHFYPGLSRAEIRSMPLWELQEYMKVQREAMTGKREFDLDDPDIIAAFPKDEE
jgi:hypothetical protein